MKKLFTVLAFLGLLLVGSLLFAKIRLPIEEQSRRRLASRTEDRVQWLRRSFSCYVAGGGADTTEWIPCYGFTGKLVYLTKAKLDTTASLALQVAPLAVDTLAVSDTSIAIATASDGSNLIYDLNVGSAIVGFPYYRLILTCNGSAAADSVGSGKIYVVEYEFIK